MGLLDNPEENIFRRYQDLCTNLNMDKDAAEQAWQSYETIRQNYTLEGDQLHWLGCALYVACRRSSIPTVGKPGSVVEGNCVSLTRLLRLCKLSLIQFFNKSKKWADMASMPPEFRSKIERLERNFAVSTVIFKKFQPIFVDMFHKPIEEQPKQQRCRKQRSLPCTPSKLFDFSWTLFVCVKSEFKDISDDLVNSYHLLLACCDLIFGNALIADRRDIFNRNFPGLPDDYWHESYKPPDSAPCIIEHLCTNHDGIPIEAKSIKEFYWKNHIKKLFERRILKGDATNLCGILDPGNFELNFKAINKTYEEYVLNVGDFDERIFLGDDANSDIGTPTKMFGLGEFTEQLQAKKNGQQYVGQMHHLIPSTPLTGRQYLRNKDIQPNVTPVSTATQSVIRLQSLLAGRQAAPSEALLKIFRQCAQNPKERIERQIKELGDLFCQQYTQQLNKTQTVNIDFARRRLLLGERLYYKLLENILIDEAKRKPGLDLANVLEKEMFHHSLFACCLEIVIYSYNSQRTFPWILEALNLPPYYFYKIIEIIVRAEDQLSRDVVKHLNLIDEQVLESKAWKSGSPLWEDIESSGQPVPSYEDVSLPGQTVNFHQSPAVQSLGKSIEHSCDKSGNKTEAADTTVTQSPVSSASERFQSPVPPNSSAKKRLFVDGGTGNTSVIHMQQANVRPGQSLLQSSNPVTFNIQTIQDNNGQRYIPISYMPSTGSVIIQAQSQGPHQGKVQAESQQTQDDKEKDKEKDKKPRVTGPLGLFFRKFYHLASVRMQELCNQLEITDNELKSKIWTCFEYTIMNQTDLMQDRHLDQILMCAVYVMCKVSQKEKTFTEIMRCYRFQPQATSHVYRSVLLAKRRRGSGSSSNGTSSTSSPVPPEADNKEDVNVRSSSTLPVMQPPSTPSTPTHLAGTSNTFESGDRGDLIKFYNTVYVVRVQSFAVKFSVGGPPAENLTLSPLPLAKCQPMSPRRISDKHFVYIRPLEQHKLHGKSPSQPFCYCFSRSPAKDLHQINKIVSGRVGKRLLVDDSTDTSDDIPRKRPTPGVAKKLQDIMADRWQAQD